MKPHPFEIMQSASAWTSRECADEYSVSEETWNTWVGDIDMRWLDVDTSNPGVARAVREGWQADFDVAQALGVGVKGLRQRAAAALDNATRVYGEYQVASAPRGWPGGNLMLRNPYAVRTPAQAQPKPKPSKPAPTKPRTKRMVPSELVGEGWSYAKDATNDQLKSAAAVAQAYKTGKAFGGRRVERSPKPVATKNHVAYMYRWVSAEKGHDNADLTTNKAKTRKSPERLAREARYAELFAQGWRAPAELAKEHGESSYSRVTQSARFGTPTERGNLFESSEVVQQPHTGNKMRLYRALPMTREGNVVEDGDGAQAPNAGTVDASYTPPPTAREAAMRAFARVAQDKVGATTLGGKPFGPGEWKREPIGPLLTIDDPIIKPTAYQTHTKLREAAQMAVGVLMCCAEGKHERAVNSVLDLLWAALEEDGEVCK